MNRIIVREVIINTLFGAMKLGILASSSILLNKAYKECVDIYLTKSFQYFRQIKFVFTNGEA